MRCGALARKSCGAKCQKSSLSTFERAWGAHVGVKHVCGVNAGTDALILALLALGVGPGDEVITQANTF
jgi:dTDP-4-amino-4,6-dideoxygalactose transaminase